MANSNDNTFKDEYNLLRAVLDALLSQRATPEMNASAERLVERGFLVKDAEGRFRLAAEGERVLREGARHSRRP